MSNQPGPELDAKVAIAFGHNVINEIQGYYWLDEPFKPLPQYSTTWEGMGLVVEEMQRRGYEFRCSSRINWGRPPEYHAMFFKNVEDFGERTSEYSLQHAVAEAALGALEGKKYA